MSADGQVHSLQIFGNFFASGNVVQFKWGQGAGANIWTNSEFTPTVTANQITLNMRPGSVTDTIYVRVCSKDGSSNCSSGTQYISVTATPSVSSIKPTSMNADGQAHSLQIFGTSFASGNVVQFKWGQGAGANVWTNSKSTPAVTSNQVTVSMNPGTVTDTIYVRVCSSSGSSNCSSGAQYVSVTK